MGRNKDVSWAHFIFHCLLGRTFWNILLLRKHLEPIVYQVRGGVEGGGVDGRYIVRVQSQNFHTVSKTWIFKTDPNDFKRGLPLNVVTLCLSSFLAHHILPHLGRLKRSKLVRWAHLRITGGNIDNIFWRNKFANNVVIAKLIHSTK